MANGKNAGRLFPDCTNEHGYGEYHAVPADAAVGDTVTCHHCGQDFINTETGLKRIPEVQTEVEE